MTGGGKLWVRTYLGSVYAAGALALGWVVVTAQWYVPAHLIGLVAVVAALMIASEFFPIMVWNRERFQEYTFSGAFALVLLQIAPLVWAVLPQVLALLVEETRQRKSLKVTAFNVAQHVLMFVLARLALGTVEGVGLGPTNDVSAPRQLLGLAVAAAVYFVVNNSLTATIVALTSGANVGRSILATMYREFPVTPIVLGLAPMFAASLEFSIWTAPLCLALTIAIRSVVKISTDHQIAALHDPLTGLPNRTLMLKRLKQSLRRVGSERQTALLMIDLDHFKEINDSLGHGTGDELLEHVAGRLSDAVGPGDTVARLGGDEFAIVVGDTTTEDAEGLAKRVTGTLNESFRLTEVTLNVAASVGVAVAPTRSIDPITLLRNADQALYAAKQERGRYTVYDPATAEHGVGSPVLVGELKTGIERGELRVHFQPKVSIRTGRMTGVEALVRWQHPTRGLLTAGRFLPAAENTPLIVPLTEQVIRESLAAVAQWRSEDRDVNVSINLTARQVANQDLPDQIEEALRAYGLPGEALLIEMTESCLIANPVRTRDVLNRLRDLGVGLSIDDFGTGYSSFTQLRDLPVSEIKIDKSFVTSVTGSTANAAIVKSAIDLGHNLGLHVVSEGVETLACLDALTDMGCDVMQGFLFARPMPAEEVQVWSPGRALIVPAVPSLVVPVGVPVGLEKAGTPC